MTQRNSTMINQGRSALLIGAVGYLVLAQTASSSDPAQIVKHLGLTEVATTLDDADIERCMNAAEGERATADPREQALLSCLGLHGDAEQIKAMWNRHPVYSLLADLGEPQWLQDNRATVKEFEDRLLAVMNAGLSTGYNITPHSAWQLFDPDRTVIYGHTNWQHARQLLALLEIKGLQPRVDLILKQSSFVFRDSWGEPSRPLRQLNDGRRIAGGVEFDLLLEFESKDNIRQFAALVTRYAKKDETDEPGLLLGSSWQPFYRTRVPYKGAHEITVILVSYQGFRANLTSLPKDAALKVTQLRRMYPDWQVEPITVWVNPGFYRFLGGDYR